MTVKGSRPSHEPNSPNFSVHQRVDLRGKKANDQTIENENNSPAAMA
jgi:hypothetical protein